MKTYIYYRTEDNKTFSENWNAQDINEAEEIATITGWELKGEKVGEKATDIVTNGLSLRDFESEESFEARKLACHYKLNEIYREIFGHDPLND